MINMNKYLRFLGIALALSSLGCRKESAVKSPESLPSKEVAKAHVRVHREPPQLLKEQEGVSSEDRESALNAALMSVPLDESSQKDRNALLAFLRRREGQPKLQEDQGYGAWKILHQYENAKPLEQAALGLLALQQRSHPKIDTYSGTPPEHLVMAEAQALLYLAAGVLPGDVPYEKVIGHCRALILNASEGQSGALSSPPAANESVEDRVAFQEAINERNRVMGDWFRFMSCVPGITTSPEFKMERNHLDDDLDTTLAEQVSLSDTQYQKAESALEKYENAPPVQQLIFGRLVYIRLNSTGYGATLSPALTERNPLHAETNQMAIELMRKGLGPDAKNLSVPDLIKKADETLRKAAGK